MHIDFLLLAIGNEKCWSIITIVTPYASLREGFFFFITDSPLHLSKIISLKKWMKSTQFFERTLTYADIYRYLINNLKEKTIAPNILLLSWMHSQLKHTESTRKQSYADNDVITPFVSLSFRRFVYQVSLFYQSFKL